MLKMNNVQLSWFFWLIQTSIMFMFLTPGHNGPPCLSYLYSTTHNWVFNISQPSVALDNLVQALLTCASWQMDPTMLKRFGLQPNGFKTCFHKPQCIPDLYLGPASVSILLLSTSYVGGYIQEELVVGEAATKTVWIDFICNMVGTKELFQTLQVCSCLLIHQPPKDSWGRQVWCFSQRMPSFYQVRIG